MSLHFHIETTTPKKETQTMISTSKSLTVARQTLNRATRPRNLSLSTWIFDLGSIPAPPISGKPAHVKVQVKIAEKKLLPLILMGCSKLSKSSTMDSKRLNDMPRRNRSRQIRPQMMNFSNRIQEKR
jgi:hypothetical protein